MRVSGASPLLMLPLLIAVSDLDAAVVNCRDCGMRFPYLC